MKLNVSFDYYHEAIDAATNNDINKLKEILNKIGLIKQPNPIKDIIGDIHYYFKTLGKDSFYKTRELERVEDLFRVIIAITVDNNSSEIYKYIIESKELKIKLNLNKHFAWSSAIRVNNFEVVKYLINVDKKNDKSEVIFNSLAFHTRCSVKMAKYLIDDKSMPFHESLNKLLKEYGKYTTPVSEFTNLNIGTLFIKACERKDRQIVYYLLKHETYGKMIDNFSFFEGICQAFSSNDAKLVKYLLTNKNMPLKPYKDYDPRKLLQIAAKNMDKNMLDYLILDFQITKPHNSSLFFDREIIAKNIAPFSHQFEIDEYNKMVEYTHHLFKRRELYNALQIDLGTNQNAPKNRNKI